MPASVAACTALSQRWYRAGALGGMSSGLASCSCSISVYRARRDVLVMNASSFLRKIPADVFARSQQSVDNGLQGADTLCCSGLERLRMWSGFRRVSAARSGRQALGNVSGRGNAADAPVCALRTAHLPCFVLAIEGLGGWKPGFKRMAGSAGQVNDDHGRRCARVFANAGQICM